MDDLESKNSVVSQLLGAAEQGDPVAAGKLFDVLYGELHRLAKRELARHGGGMSLSPTTLLHEAYLDMAGRDSHAFPDRARFMAYAARVMRGLLIDHARNRHAIKRGGQFEITSLELDQIDCAVDAQELTQLSEALDELAQVDSSLSQIVDLKFFCGFSFSEIAAMRGVSERTIQRGWEQARIFLHRRLCADLPV